MNRVDLFIEMFEGSLYGLSNSFQHDFVYIVYIGFPDRRFLVNVYFGMDFTD